MPLTRAHLVGSLPYPNADTTFREITSRLGGHLKRIPDGGDRGAGALDLLAAGEGREPPGDGGRGGRGQGADPPVGRQTDSGMGAVPLQAGRRSGGGRVRPRLRAGGHRVIRPVRGAARGRHAAGGRPFPGLPADADGGRLLVRLAGLAAGLLRRLRARLQGRSREDLRRDPARRPRDPVGRLPGGAGLGGLFSQPAGKLQGGHNRHAGAARRRGAGTGPSSATISATARRTTSTW